MKMHHPHACDHAPMHPHGHGMPHGLLLFPLAMVTSAYLSLWLLKRITSALETMALAKALHDLEGRLSDGERAELEGRIRLHLFTA
jgi:hypothetical protein